MSTIQTAADQQCLYADIMTGAVGVLCRKIHELQQSVVDLHRLAEENRQLIASNDVALLESAKTIADLNAKLAANEAYILDINTQLKRKSHPGESAGFSTRDGFVDFDYNIFLLTEYPFTGRVKIFYDVQPCETSADDFNRIRADFFKDTVVLKTFRVKEFGNYYLDIKRLDDINNPTRYQSYSYVNAVCGNWLYIDRVDIDNFWSLVTSRGTY